MVSYYDLPSISSKWEFYTEDWCYSLHRPLNNYTYNLSRHKLAIVCYIPFSINPKNLLLNKLEKVYDKYYINIYIMNKIMIVLIMWLNLGLAAYAEESIKETHIYINLTKKTLCSNRLNKCWPVAVGNKTNPTPSDPGPHYVLTHYKNGFDWQNPFTKKIYKKGTHNLGNIWISIVTQSNGIVAGIHQTPQLNIPISQQESLGGCVRMLPKDIIEFSNSIKYLDEIYIVK